MCLILDANMYTPFLKLEEDMKPVRDWVDNKNGKIVYPVGKLKDELKKGGTMYKKFEEYRKAGRLKLIDPTFVEEKKAALPKLKSNDPDIIALAQASGVKLLVSEDIDLHADFKKIIGGKVYQKKVHGHLLRKDLCP